MDGKRRVGSAATDCRQSLAIGSRSLATQGLRPTAIALALGLLPGAAAALPGDRLAPGDQRVNTLTFGAQRWASVAMDPRGDFLVAWFTYGGDGDDLGVLAQRYDSHGAAVDGETVLNLTTAGWQFNPDVASAAGGEFFAAWQSEGDIVARRISGDAGSPEILVYGDTYTQANPSVACDLAGNCVVAWENFQDNTLGLRRFDARNRPLGGIETETVGVSTQPDVAMNAAGDYVVTWVDGDVPNGEVWAHRYTRHGLPQGDPVLVGPGLEPAVAVDPDGGFVVVSAFFDGANRQIQARRFDAGSVQQGATIEVSPLGQGLLPASVAMDEFGGFAVAWSAHGSDGDGAAVLGRRYDRQGIAQGATFVVNHMTTGWQYAPALAMSQDGRFVVAFENDGADGSSNGIYMARYGGYDTFAAVVPDLNGNFTPEIAGLAWNGAAWQARVRDGFTGEVLGSVNFSAGWDVADFAFYGDALAPQLAAYARKPDGTLNRLELRPLAGGVNGVNVATHRPLRLVVTADANNNGSADIALLDVNDASGAGRTLVRDGASLASIRTTNLSADWLPVDLSALPDLSGNARPEVAVLAQHRATGAVRVESRDAFSGTLVNATDFNPDYVPARLLVAPDTNGNGRPELVVAGFDDAGGEAAVQVLDAVTDRVVGILRYPTWAAVAGAAVLPDQDGNGKPEIALLQQDPATGRPRVELRDADTDAFVRAFPYAASLSARNLLLLDDYDGTGGPELAVVAVRRDGADRVQVRDSISGGVIKTSPLP